MCQTLTGQQAERSCRERGSGGKLLWFHSGSVMLVLHTSCNFFFFSTRRFEWLHTFEGFSSTNSHNENDLNRVEHAPTG